MLLLTQWRNIGGFRVREYKITKQVDVCAFVIRSDMIKESWEKELRENSIIHDNIKSKIT